MRLAQTILGPIAMLSAWGIVCLPVYLVANLFGLWAFMAIVPAGWFFASWMCWMWLKPDGSEEA